MRYSFIIYPEAEERLKSSGLAERTEKCLKSDRVPDLNSYTFPDHIQQDVEYLKRTGYIKFLSDEEKRKLQEIFNEKKGYYWRTRRGRRVIKERTEPSDILLLLGYPASFILSSQEMENPESFGFSSSIELNGVIGAFMVEMSHTNLLEEQGLKWQTQTKNGRILVNEIAGNMHYDLQINQRDITPYRTTDPLGNIVNYRPEFYLDKQIVMSHHNTEPELLVSLLKYAEQLGIESRLLKNNAQELVQWTLSLGQEIGFTAEHLSGSDYDPRMSFVFYDIPIPKLDSNFSTREHTNYGLSSDRGYYRIFIGPERELVFSLQDDINDPRKPVTISFKSEEFGHVLKGLFYQAAKGLGRTSARELIGALEYKFSGEYERDLERLRGYEEEKLKQKII